ncbi:uncharacterized protein LOC113295338 [Papaver somniferum]|uniref:uncharacterized protein LOC113295338 n=1 Tax=Papaver somniferum TaxID=3469 RepID=UPI000E70270D|nr:uncharacterized protein LOC113295338 [Papaver somniferum]
MGTNNFTIKELSDFHRQNLQKFTDLEDKVTKLSQKLDEQSTDSKAFHEKMSNSFDLLDSQMAELLQNSRRNNGDLGIFGTPGFTPPRENPRGWVQKSERYFQIHNIEEHQKVSVASIYLEGKADKWFLNFQIAKPFLSWKKLSEGVYARFENPVDDNFIGSFNKLCQVTTVEEYFEQFEALMLKSNPHLTEQYFVMSFISGLKAEIKNFILMFCPATLLQAFSLARMQEHKSRSGNTTPKSSPPISPIKKLTREQMRARKEKGSCYNCDVVYTPGHICKRQQLFMVQVEQPESSEEVEEEIYEEDVESPVESDMEISLHALTGNANGDTIRIPCTIKKQKISILTDTGSTHNFIDCALVKSLKCQIEQTTPMLVTVDNGDKTVSTGVCSQLHWSMQGHKFSEDLRMLPLGGCDMVLGADWLRKKGDVIFNLSKICISFIYQGKKITLQGTTDKVTLKMMSCKAFKNFLSKTSHGLIGQVSSTALSEIPTSVPEPFTKLIHEFQDIFDNPKQLPPTRILYPSIPLKPNS